MWGELLRQAWVNLRRNLTRSLLTMLGIVWGIVAVTVLMAYGSGFRAERGAHDAPRSAER